MTIRNGYHRDVPNGDGRPHRTADISDTFAPARLTIYPTGYYLTGLPPSAPEGRHLLSEVGTRSVAATLRPEPTEDSTTGA
jgi:hypothetical protein